MKWKENIDMNERDFDDVCCYVCSLQKKTWVSPRLLTPRPPVTYSAVSTILVVSQSVYCVFKELQLDSWIKLLCVPNTLIENDKLWCTCRSYDHQFIRKYNLKKKPKWLPWHFSSQWVNLYCSWLGKSS